jgi:hypothetical protein
MPRKNELQAVLWKGDTLYIPEIRVRLLGAAFSIVGYKLIFTLKSDITQPDSEAEVYYEHLISADDALGQLGRHNIVIESEITDTLESGLKYTYQLIFVSPAGKTTTHHWGALLARDS